MPFLIGLVAIAGAAYFWIMRARNAAEMTSELAGVANDVYLAAKRFKFRRKTNVHPVESIEENALGIASICCAFLEIGSLPTKDERDRLHVQLQSKLELSKKDAEEMIILGRWLVNECQSPSAAVTRISRRLYKISGMDTFADLLRILQAALPNEWNANQMSALEDVKQAFKIR